MAGEPVDVRVLRPEDLLVLDITLTNLAVGDDGALHVVDRAAPGRMVFRLPPQHIAEAAFLENETTDYPVTPLPVRSASAAPSRLAFDVPADGPGVPFTVAGLLDWAALRPALAPNALPPGTPTTTGGVRPAEPAPDVTALELAYRMIVSPVGEHGWQHRSDPHTADGVTELWHTRLVGTDPLSVRAISGRETNPFLTSLTTGDITDLVMLTGDFGNAVKSAAELGIPYVLWLLWTRRLSPWGRADRPAAGHAHRPARPADRPRRAPPRAGQVRLPGRRPAARRAGSPGRRRRPACRPTSTSRASVATSTSRSSGAASSTPGTVPRSSRSPSAGSSRCRWAPSPVHRPGRGVRDPDRPAAVLPHRRHPAGPGLPPAGSRLPQGPPGDAAPHDRAAHARDAQDRPADLVHGGGHPGGDRPRRQQPDLGQGFGPAGAVRLRQHRRRGPPGQPAQADAVHPVLVRRQHRRRHHHVQRRHRRPGARPPPARRSSP